MTEGEREREIEENRLLLQMDILHVYVHGKGHHIQCMWLTASPTTLFFKVSNVLFVCDSLICASM